jgi:putative peptidoglycan lipid II flippase
VKIGFFTLVATQLMNLAFIGWLQHAGLALSIGLAACLNAALLYRGLRRRASITPQPGWMAFSLKLLVALAIMGGALWWPAAATRRAGSPIRCPSGCCALLCWWGLA